MEAEIIVQHKWIKGKQCMSTQVSFKQWRSTLHLVTNARAPYLSEGYVPMLIICKWQSWGIKEGHSRGRGHMEDEPRRGEELGVIFCSLRRGPAKALHLCQTLPFCFNYPISMIQFYVRALRGWSWAVSRLKCSTPYSLSVLFYLGSMKLTFHPRCGLRLPYASVGTWAIIHRRARNQKQYQQLGDCPQSPLLCVCCS